MGSDLIGSPTPEESGEAYSRQTYNLNGFDVSATGTSRIGRVMADEVEVVAVRVDGGTGFDINVELAGGDVFSSEQTVSNDPSNRLTPDQNDALSDSDDYTLEVDVSSAGTGTANIAVEVEQK